MADPNLTQAITGSSGPTGGANTASGSGKGYNPQEEKQVFMKMLVAQMRNQSPSNPMDANKMTEQLAQLNSVEQQIKGNDFLEQLVNQRQGQQQMQAASLLGRQAWVDGSTLRMASSGEGGSYRFNLKESQDVAVQITDQYGRKVHEERLGTLDAGSHEFSWDGTLPDGQAAPAGDYQVRVAPTGEERGDAVTTQVQRTIQEVRFGDSGTEVGIGNGNFLPFDKISAVSA